MGLINKLIKVVDIFLEEENENYDKGVEFERYVAQIFGKQKDYFTIEEWTRDNSDKREGIKVESDKNPDFIIRYNPTGERFAIECKFRSQAYYNEKLRGNVVRWSIDWQIKRYNDFSYARRIPVFIVIGLGGTPTNPENMFCIPLEEAKYPEMYMSILKKYERQPGKTFFWKNGILK
jgi:hypothetical protein